MLSLAAACESDADTAPRQSLPQIDAGQDSGVDAGMPPPLLDSGSQAPGLDAGSMSPPPPPFRLRLDGRMLVLDTLGHGSWSFRECSTPFVLEKFGNAWGPIRDERPHDGRGYYLDGEFMRGDVAMCDASSCPSLGKTRDIARAEEYVQIGTKRPPPDQPDPDKPVFMVSTRPLAGPLRLIVNYHVEKSCGGAQQSAVIDLTIPTEGVCCPIGPPACSSPGPGGGWAMTYAECPTFDGAFNVAFVAKAEAHGCPVLEPDPTMCCGNCTDEDGGSATTGSGTGTGPAIPPGTD
jgi:hypothetical protein